MRKLLLTCIVAAVLSAMPLPARACGGGGCGMGGGGGGMGGRGGYYGGARAKASTKVLSGGPRVARSALPAGRALVTAAKPAQSPTNAKRRAAPQARTVAAKAKAAAPPIYTCPMHPQVQWTKPTDCPICGMKLKLKRAKNDAPRRTPPTSDGANLSTDEMSEMPDMEDEMGGMDDMMCCPGCIGGMSGMSGGKKNSAASRKASGGSMRGMVGMGCGC